MYNIPLAAIYTYIVIFFFISKRCIFNTDFPQDVYHKDASVDPSSGDTENHTPKILPTSCKVADLSPIHFRKQSATDNTKLDLYILVSRVWL